MAKKQKITVNLPGGIAGLVHTVQRGESAPAREESRVEEQPVAPENEQTPQSITEKTVEKPPELMYNRTNSTGVPVCPSFYHRTGCLVNT